MRSLKAGMGHAIPILFSGGGTLGASAPTRASPPWVTILFRKGSLGGLAFVFFENRTRRATRSDPTCETQALSLPARRMTPAGLPSSMANPSQHRLQLRMIVFSGVAGVYAVLTGILVLIGWWWNVDLLKRVFPGMISMNPITAIGFIMGGFSLWLQSGRKNGPLAMILAAAVTAVGLWFCGCYLYGGDPVIDTSLFSSQSRVFCFKEGIVGRKNAQVDTFLLLLLIMVVRVCISVHGFHWTFVRYTVSTLLWFQPMILLSMVSFVEHVKLGSSFIFSTFGPVHEYRLEKWLFWRHVLINFDRRDSWIVKRDELHFRVAPHDEKSQCFYIDCSYWSVLHSNKFRIFSWVKVQNFHNTPNSLQIHRCNHEPIFTFVAITYRLLNVSLHFKLRHPHCRRHSRSNSNINIHLVNNMVPSYYRTEVSYYWSVWHWNP